MSPDRRAFLRRTGGCLAQLALLDAAGWTGPGLFAADHRHPVVGQEPWGRLERVADGVWALISTPLEDRLTLCNGGIVEGSDGVAMVEAFASPEGSRWMAQQARRLTGRWPDRVIVTHFHGDHVGGLGQLPALNPAPAAHMTATTRSRVREGAGTPAASGLMQALDSATLVPSDRATQLDLGGRSLRLVPRSGHTASDVTVEVDDPSVVFCGDLVWHRYFPNFVDAQPAALTASVRQLTRSRDTTYVPGHGPLADPAELARFQEFLLVVENHARGAHAAGRTVKEAAATLRLPPSFADWFMFSDRYPERAFAAWYGELDRPGYLRG